MLPLVIAAASCSRETPKPAKLNDGSERYRFLKGAMVADDELSSVRAGLPFQRIERSEFDPWSWDSPTITLELNGSASMNDTPPKAGKVSIFDFGRLCLLIEHIGFESFKPRYDWDGFDATTVTIKVWRVGSDQPIVVEDYGGVGPEDLWTLSAAIEGVASHVHWE